VIIPLFTSVFMVNYSNESFAEKSLVINPKSLIHMQDNVYLLIFEGCTGSESIMINELEIVSDTETLLLVEYAEGRSIPPQECRFLQVQIQAEDSSSITIVVESLGISHSIDPKELQKDALSYAELMKITTSKENLVLDLADKVSNSLLIENKHKEILRDIAIQFYDWKNVSRKLGIELESM